MFKATFEKAGSGDMSWLGSSHATDAAQTVTLDGSKVSDSGMQKSGLPSGLPLEWNAEGTKVVPCTTPANLAGFLLTPQEWYAGDLVVPMLVHGVVKAKNLPVEFATATVTNGAFTFLGKKGA